MNKNKWSDFYSYLSVDEYLYNLSRHRFLLSRLLKLKPRSVLEAGTGSGSLSIFLSAQGLSVVSIDNDNEVLERAKKNCRQFKGNVNFILTDALSHLPFDDGFDVAFSQGVAEHFSDEQIKIFVGNQLRVSRCVIISVPNRSYWQSFGDERLMSTDEWSNILSDFNIREIRDYGIEVPGRSYLKHKLLSLKLIDIIRPHHIYIKIDR